MTDKTRAIFSDSRALRDKLRIYLQTPEKVEIYAQAAEAMFEKGKGEKVEFVATWSWWAFFFPAIFLAYRKCTVTAIGVYFLLDLLLLAITFSKAAGATAVGVVFLFAWLGLRFGLIPARAQYEIIKDFETTLDGEGELAKGTSVGAAIAFVVLNVVFMTFFRLIGQASQMG